MKDIKKHQAELLAKAGAVGRYSYNAEERCGVWGPTGFRCKGVKFEKNGRFFIDVDIKTREEQGHVIPEYTIRFSGTTMEDAERAADNYCQGHSDGIARAIKAAKDAVK